MNLADLLIKIGIDTKKVSDGLKVIRGQLQAFASNVGSKFSEYGKQFGSALMGGLSSALSSVWGLTAIVATGIGLMVKGITEFADKEKAVSDLNSTLKQIGDTSGSTSQKIQDLADELEDFYNVDDSDFIKASERIAVVTGATGDTLVDLTKIAAGLSRQFGVDMPTAVDMLDKSLAGNMRWMKSYGIIVDEAADANVSLQKVLDLSAAGMNKQKEAAGTTANEIARLKKDWNNAVEDMGAGALRFLDVFTKLGYGIAKVFGYDYWKYPDKAIEPLVEASKEIEDLANRKRNQEKAKEDEDRRIKDEEDLQKKQEAGRQKQTTELNQLYDGIEDMSNNQLEKEDSLKGKLAKLETDRKRKDKEIAEQIANSAFNEDIDAINRLSALRVQYEKQFASDKQAIIDEANKKELEKKKKLAEEVAELQNEIADRQLKEQLQKQEELLSEDIANQESSISGLENNIGKSLLMSALSGSGVSNSGVQSGLFQGPSAIAGDNIGKQQLSVAKDQLKTLKEALKAIKEQQSGLG